MVSTTFPRNSFCTKQNMGHTNCYTYLNSNNCGHFYSTVSPDSETNYMYTMPRNNVSIHTCATYITLKRKKKQKHFEGMATVLLLWMAVEGILTCNNVTQRVSSAPKQRLLSPLLYVQQQKWSGLKCPLFFLPKESKFCTPDVLTRNAVAERTGACPLVPSPQRHRGFLSGFGQSSVSMIAASELCIDTMHALPS